MASLPHRCFSNSTVKCTKDVEVLVLGAGMAGTIAARTLHEKGIENFIIIEGNTDFGGRMLYQTFGV